MLIIYAKFNAVLEELKKKDTLTDIIALYILGSAELETF